MPWSLRDAERQLAHRAEATYRRTVADRTATRPANVGCGRDTGARIS
jgi:hypothetical protein